MPLEFTAKGYIEVWRNGEKLSQHRQEREAVESISGYGPGTYRIKYPDVEVVSRLDIVVFPQDTTPPTVPVITSVTAVSDTRLDVAWSAATDSGSGVNGYKVYRATSSGGTYTLLATLSSASLVYSNTGLSAETQYFYKVSAFDVQGNESAQSFAGNGTTQSSQGGGEITPLAEFASLELTSSATGTFGATVGHVFREGDVPSGTQPWCDADSYQWDVRNYWSDGSAKYAVLSVIDAFTASTPKTVSIGRASSAPTGSDVSEPTSLDVTVAFTSGVNSGNTYTLQSCLGVDRSTWSLGNAGRVRQILGKVMSEFHYYRPTADAHVTIWFYVRRYANGATEVETVVENGWLGVASPSSKRYAATVSVGGSTVYSDRVHTNEYTPYPSLQFPTALILNRGDTNHFNAGSQFWVNGDQSTIYEVGASYGGTVGQVTLSGNVASAFNHGDVFYINADTATTFRVHASHFNGSNTILLLRRVAPSSTSNIAAYFANPSSFTINGGGTSYSVVANTVELATSCVAHIVSGTLSSVSTVHLWKQLHHTRWSRVDWVGTDPGITALHDVAYLRESKMVPNYGYGDPTSGAFTGLASAKNPTPFALGNWSLDMGSTGHQAAIGVLPQWESLYCASGDYRARDATISNQRGSGRWPIHYRDETTGRVPIHSSYPSLCLTSGWGTPPPTPSGGGTVWDIAHHPSNGYLPYLLEGRWPQLESIQFSAMFALLDSNTGTRKNGAGATGGSLLCANAPLTTRGAAWAWRTAGEAAAITPSNLSGADAAVRTSLVAIVQDTVSFNRARYITGALDSGTYQNTIGWVGHYDSYSGGGAEFFRGGAWMVRFQGMAFAHIAELDIEGMSAPSHLTEVRDFVLEGIIADVNESDTSWNWRRAATYERTYLKDFSAPFSSPVFMTNAEAFAAYKSIFGLGSLSSTPGSTIKDHATEVDMNNGSSTNAGSGFAATMASCLAMAIDAGIDGAVAKHTLFTGASNFDPEGSGANDVPQFAMVPRTSIPQYILDIPEGEWSGTANTNSLADVAYAWGTGGWPSIGGASVGSMLTEWCGAAYDTTHERFYLWGGGHGSYPGNEFYAISMDDPQFRRVSTPSPYASEGDGTLGKYPDGLRVPQHTYGEMDADSNTGNVWILGNGGSAAQKSFAFEPDYAPWPMSYADTLNAFYEVDISSGNGYGIGYGFDPVNGRFYGGTSPGGSQFFEPRYYDPSVPSTATFGGTGAPSGYAPGYYATVAVDPVGRRMYSIGGGFIGTGGYIKRGTVLYNIDANSWEDLTATTTGDKTPEISASGGATYDSYRGVMWYFGGLPIWDAGGTGSDLYHFHYPTKVWTKVTAPTAPAVYSNGTFNRFRYVAKYDVLAVITKRSADNYPELRIYKPVGWRFG